MKYLLFDFDGVLVDSFDMCYQTSLQVNPKMPSAEGYREYFNGNIFEAKDIVMETSSETQVDANDPFFSIYTPALLKLPPIDGVIDVVRRLHAEGTRKLAVVSSTINSPIEQYLELHGLRSLFDAVYGADVHKSKVVKMKMALEAFGARLDEAVFITDTLGDVREAAKVGLRAIGVTWGFHDEARLQEGNPLAIVRTPEELFAYIERS